MDVSCRFNETGVKLYQQGRGSEAYDMFHASIEVQMLTQGRTTACLDSFQCQSLAFFDDIAQALKMDLRERSCQAKSFQSPSFLAGESDAMDFEFATTQTCTPGDSSSLPFVSLNSRRLSKDDDPYLFDKLFAWQAPVCPKYEQYVVYIAMDLYNMALILQKD